MSTIAEGAGSVNPTIDGNAQYNALALCVCPIGVIMLHTVRYNDLKGRQLLTVEGMCTDPSFDGLISFLAHAML